MNHLNTTVPAICFALFALRVCLADLAAAWKRESAWFDATLGHADKVYPRPCGVTRGRGICVQLV